MKNYLFIAFVLLLFCSCRKRYEAPVPNLDWDQYNSAAAIPLKNATGRKIESVYTIEDANDVFGSDAALKWSYTINGTDTTYQLSFFCQKDITYFICEGKHIDSTILLNGYWRRMVGTETGKARLTIAANAGGAKLLRNTPLTSNDEVIISGTYGISDAVPETPIRFSRTRPLNTSKPLEIVAHRGGGRSADLLPASENSVEIIKLASRFGATGIEIDVRMTSDGVPILFHDATLNERLIIKNGMIGPIENYSYAQLSNLIKLINGERIPTLREALNTMLYNTPLHYVWLDTKFSGSIQQVRDMQVEFLQKAAAIGRNINITIGIPDKDVLANFKKLPDYRNIPSVNELTPDDVQEVNSSIWGPRFTLGLQNEEVNIAHSVGRRVFVWTLDTPDNIREYLYNGQFDGILTNYPSAVAYYYYARQ